MGEIESTIYISSDDEGDGVAIADEKMTVRWPKLAREDHFFPRSSLLVSRLNFNKLKPLRKVPDNGGVRWHWSLPFTQKRRGEHARALKTRTSHC